MARRNDNVVDRDITSLRTGVKFDGEAPPPMLGADNDRIYPGLGLSTEELACLKREGVI